jgi:hypothetical protein
MEEKGCPNLANHTPLPDGYIERRWEMERLGRKHTQTKCPDCGLWAIWVKK